MRRGSNIPVLISSLRSLGATCPPRTQQRAQARAAHDLDFATGERRDQKGWRPAAKRPAFITPDRIKAGKPKTMKMSETPK